MMNRNVQLNIEPDVMEKSYAVAGPEKVWNAIGYLSTWNMGYYKVAIWGEIYDGKPEFTATYYKDNGEVGYVIGGVWHDDHFGFHS